MLIKFTFERSTKNFDVFKEVETSITAGSLYIRQGTFPTKPAAITIEVKDNSPV